MVRLGDEPTRGRAVSARGGQVDDAVGRAAGQGELRRPFGDGERPRTGRAALARHAGLALAVGAAQADAQALELTPAVVQQMQARASGRRR